MKSMIKYTSNNILKAQLKETNHKSSEPTLLSTVKQTKLNNKIISLEDSTTMNLVDIMTNMFKKDKSMPSPKQENKSSKNVGRSSHVRIVKKLNEDMDFNKEENLVQTLLNQSTVSNGLKCTMLGKSLLDDSINKTKPFIRDKKPELKYDELIGLLKEETNNKLPNVGFCLQREEKKDTTTNKVLVNKPSNNGKTPVNRVSDGRVSINEKQKNDKYEKMKTYTRNISVNNKQITAKTLNDNKINKNKNEVIPKEDENLHTVVSSNTLLKSKDSAVEVINKTSSLFQSQDNGQDFHKENEIKEMPNFIESPISKLKITNLYETNEYISLTKDNKEYKAELFDNEEADIDSDNCDIDMDMDENVSTPKQVYRSLTKKGLIYIDREKIKEEVKRTELDLSKYDQIVYKYINTEEEEDQHMPPDKILLNDIMMLKEKKESARKLKGIYKGELKNLRHELKELIDYNNLEIDRIKYKTNFQEGEDNKLKNKLLSDLENVKKIFKEKEINYKRVIKSLMVDWKNMRNCDVSRDEISELFDADESIFNGIFT
jgi:hypothetical protein